MESVLFSVRTSHSTYMSMPGEKETNEMQLEQQEISPKHDGEMEKKVEQQVTIEESTPHDLQVGNTNQSDENYVVSDAQNYDQLSQDYNKLKVEFDHCRATLVIQGKTLGQEKRLYEKEKADLLAQYESLRHQTKGLQQKMNNQITTTVLLEQKNQRLKEALVAKTKLAKVEAERYAAKTAQMERDLAMRERDVALRERSDIGAQLVTIKAKGDVTKGNLITASAERDVAQRELATVKRERDGAKGELIMIKAECDAAKGEIVTLKAERDAAMNKVTALKGERDVARAEVAALRKECDFAKREITKIQRERDVDIGKLITSNAELDVARRELALVTVERDGAKGELVVVKAERDTAKGEVATVTAERDGAKGEVVVVKAERDTAKGEVAIVRAELLALRRQVENLRACVATACYSPGVATALHSLNAEIFYDGPD